MLHISDLTASVEQKTILHNITYRFEKNKIYVVMGPNGSGKSSLAHVIMGNPAYVLASESQIKFGTASIMDLSPDKRAKKGIFMSFQSPLSLSGVSVFQLIRTAMGGKHDVLQLKRKMERVAKELHISADLMNRSFNEGASGGEKKKLEILQSVLLQPKFALFDEVDTGVDVDGLKLIFSVLNKYRKKSTYVFITHYGKILKYIKPDRVLIMKKGKLTQQGGASLIRRIDTFGYEKNP